MSAVGLRTSDFLFEVNKLGQSGLPTRTGRLLAALRDAVTVGDSLKPCSKEVEPARVAAGWLVRRRAMRQATAG